MGFFSKLRNFLLGRGFRDTTPEPSKTTYDQIAEDLTYIEKQPTPKPISSIPPALTTPEPTTPKRTPTTRPTQPKRKAQAVSTVSKLLSDASVTETAVPPHAETLNEYRALYIKLFKEKLSKPNRKDDTIINILIQNREKLKDRFSVNITLLDPEGPIALITASSILPETAQIVHETVTIPSTMTSSELGRALNHILHTLKESYGATGGNTQILTTKPKLQLTSMQVSVDFA